MNTADRLKRLKHRLFLTRKRAVQWRDMVLRHLSPRRRRIQRQVVRNLDLPETQGSPVIPGSVWGVSMMRNEAVLLPLLLQHFEQQGFDGLVVADNLSTDDTRKVLSEWRGKMTVLVVPDREELFYQQHKMDALAGLARGCGADWIVPFDADEFWYGCNGTVAQVLRESPQCVAMQTARVHNVVWNGSSYVAGDRPDRLPKVAFRWYPLAHLDIGNHAVSRPGETSFDLRILHFSYRSERHFIDKVRHGAKVLGYLDHDPKRPGHSWLDLNDMSDDELSRVYAEMLKGRGPDFMDWIPQGEMVCVDPFPWPEWRLA